VTGDRGKLQGAGEDIGVGVRGDRAKLHNEELYGLNCSPD